MEVQEQEKTTIIFKLILTLMKLSNNKINIKLSATTGKAASQLQNSLKNSLNTEKLTKQEKKLFPMTATTLHNLLQIHPKSQKQVFHKK
ncbi:hypothetical protein HIC20_01010 [Buchnera aphidicola (Hormaphis cornu)]|nr:hypothetical protein HIC20_01010 [Buchnera aphidicola (Hormaphis cornu)]